MPNFDSHTREQLRRSYAEAWAKQLEGKPLVPLEALLCDVIGAHPEYQALLSNVATAQAFEAAAGDRENPFLHMGLHVAIREQLAIDRPPGIAELHRQLLAQLGAPHAAEHALMEALAETLWQAQRDGTAPDEGRYLSAARHRLIKR
ncbi:MAG TPA: DUF1841 family protein [Steroidobacteraceae bacterium]|jgi:hypothetical protein